VSEGKGAWVTTINQLPDKEKVGETVYTSDRCCCGRSAWKRKERKGEAGYGGLEKLFDVASYGEFGTGGQEVKGNF